MGCGNVSWGCPALPAERRPCDDRVSVTLKMRLQWYDANISLPGCDKNMPGTVMAMARLNRPALMVYGGTIRPGTASASGQPIDIISAFQSYGGRAAAVLATPIISDDDQGLHAVCVHFPMPLI